MSLMPLSILLLFLAQVHEKPFSDLSFPGAKLNKKNTSQNKVVTMLCKELQAGSVAL